MPAFPTPGPIAATMEVAGAQVRVTASDRTDTVVRVEPIDEGTAASIDANSERGVVHDFVSSQGNSGPPDHKVMVHARTRHGDVIIQRAES